MTTTTLACRLWPSEWLAAWRPECRRLLLPTRSGPRLHETVAVVVQLADPPVDATVVGTVVSIQDDLKQHRIEIALDDASLRAVGLLTAAARSERVRHPWRPPRHRIRLPVVVRSRAAGLYMDTTSASEGGCALRWSGSLPPVGQRLALRIGLGIGGVDLRGIVRWNRALPSGAAVGVEFEPGEAAAAAWSRLLAEATRSGAPEA